MSNTADEQQPAAGGRGRATLVIALTIGLIVGAGAGSLVVGPLLAESGGGGGAHGGQAGSAADGASLEAQCEALFAEWEVEMRPPAPAAVYTIENIVLNPAQSGGTRFLMASVSFGMRDALGVDEMTLRDAEIRDIVIRTLGSKTVEQLADTNVRSTIKAEMQDQVAQLVGKRKLIDIYFPQFVIQ